MLSFIVAFSQRPVLAATKILNAGCYHVEGRIEAVSTTSMRLKLRPGFLSEELINVDLVGKAKTTLRPGLWVGGTVAALGTGYSEDIRLSCAANALRILKKGEENPGSIWKWEGALKNANHCN